MINSVSVGANVVNGTGTVSGDAMTITENGQFTASGSFSDSGVNGSFSLSITSSSTADFTWTTGKGRSREDCRRSSLSCG